MEKELEGESYRAHQQCEDGQEWVGQGDERHDSVVGGEVHWVPRNAMKYSNMMQPT